MVPHPILRPNSDLNNKITPMAEKHRKVSIYSTPQVELLCFGNTEAIDEMVMIYNFESDRLLYPDLVFIPLPKKPSDGFLLDAIMFSVIVSIYVCIVGRGYSWPFMSISSFQDETTLLFQSL